MRNRGLISNSKSCDQTVGTKSYDKITIGHTTYPRVAPLITSKYILLIIYKHEFLETIVYNIVQLSYRKHIQPPQEKK